MKRSIVAVLLGLFCALLALRPADAQVYGWWSNFTDTRSGASVPCRWRVGVRVLDPKPAGVYIYKATIGSGATARGQVPHRSWHHLRLEGLSSSGLGTSFYTLVGDLRRWDTGGNFWRYFDDTIVSGYWPPFEGPMYYEINRNNPYNYQFGPWVDWVYVSPSGQSHYCDAYTQATAHERSYDTIQVFQRIAYKVSN